MGIMGVVGCAMLLVCGFGTFDSINGLVDKIYGELMTADNKVMLSADAGYDYAYENGDNYSAVYNEVPFVFSEFELNENGLFQTKEEIVEYISKREGYEKTHKPYTLEVGDFTIFEVYEVFL